MTTTTNRAKSLFSIMGIEEPGDLPELNLRKAILDRAIADYLFFTQSSSREDARSAKRWLFSDVPRHKGEWPITFMELCDDLEIDPDVVRAYAKREKKRGVKTPLVA